MAFLLLALIASALIIVETNLYQISTWVFASVLDRNARKSWAATVVRIFDGNFTRFTGG
jgi:hypothetical protein